jgi:hypothetical protein
MLSIQERRQQELEDTIERLEHIADHARTMRLAKLGMVVSIKRAILAGVRESDLQKASGCSKAEIKRWKNELRGGDKPLPEVNRPSAYRKTVKSVPLKDPFVRIAR